MTNLDRLYSVNFSLIFEQFHAFSEPEIKSRLFTHAVVSKLIKRLPPYFRCNNIGNSFEGKPVYEISWGKGPVKILIWSQMHGNEATGTMAVFDLFNFLTHPEFIAEQQRISENCTLYFIPFVNPDGAEKWTRRNANQIDVNRDYLTGYSPEARLLKAARERIQPAFGFNLHDQNTLWSVDGMKQPATLSFLAPAVDTSGSISEIRMRAISVIADMFAVVSPLLPNQIGLFDETFEPRAFGDNFQINGTSTILIEAGGHADDYEKQEIRKYYFLSLLAGINAVANQKFSENSLQMYRSIPQNGKSLLHLIFHEVSVNGMICSVGLNYEDYFIAEENRIERRYSIYDIGDLTGWNAYQIIHINRPLLIDKHLIAEDTADFSVFDGDKNICKFEHGILVHLVF